MGDCVGPLSGADAGEAGVQVEDLAVGADEDIKEGVASRPGYGS